MERIVLKPAAVKKHRGIKAAGENGRSDRDSLLDIVRCFVFLVTAFILAFTFLARQTVVIGDSMNPTLESGDRVITCGLFYSPKYGDIVVMQKPGFRMDGFIKRVIATEGQIVAFDFIRGVVYVDGSALQEPYTLEPTYAQEHITGPVTVPEGCVFVLGDNRNNSMDSRWSTIGCVDNRYIVGKAILRIFPLQKFGVL